MDTFNYQEYLKNNILLKEDIGEPSYDSEVKSKWSTLSDDDKISLLTSVWDDSDEAEKHFEKEWADLPEAAKANMRMDMLDEGVDNDALPQFRDEFEDDSSLKKEETFSIGNMKQAYDIGHYIGRTYRDRKTISQEKEKGWKSLLRSYDPPVKDTTTENLNEGAMMDESPYSYERGIVHKIIDEVRNEYQNESMGTREYINEIIRALEDLKISDF